MGVIRSVRTYRLNAGICASILSALSHQTGSTRIDSIYLRSSGGGLTRIERTYVCRASRKRARNSIRMQLLGLTELLSAAIFYHVPPWIPFSLPPPSWSSHHHQHHGPCLFRGPGPRIKRRLSTYTELLFM